MKRRLHALFLSTSLAAVAIAPAAVVATMITADAAWANNGKGNGGGNGNGGGDKDRGGKSERSASKGGGKPSWAGQGGKPSWAGQGGSGKSQKARGGNDPVGNFLRKLTGQDKQEERRAQIAARKAPTEFAPTVSKSPGKRPARFSDMHPSEIGNMNGALNANIRAVQAKIENGNFNGPVGQMAFLAIADANVAKAERTIALYNDFQTLNDALSAAGVTVVDGDYDAAVQAYYDSGAGVESVDEAIIALGGDPESGLGLGVQPPSQDAFDEAQGALPTLQYEQLEAAAKVADYWNKNPDSTPNTIDPEWLTAEEIPELDTVLSAEELELIEDMRERLIGYEDEIAASIGEGEARALSGEIGDEAAELPETDEVCAAEEVCEEEQALLSE